MAFSDCHRLASCYIFGNLTGIAKMAFSDCSNLTTIFIQNVEWIGDYAFSGCSSLSSINIPENLEFIGEGCFLGCGALTKVNYNGTQTSWNQVAKNSDWMDGSSIEYIHCWDMMIAREEEEVSEKEIIEIVVVEDEEVEEGEEIFMIVDNMPEFPGGQQAMFKFIAENVQYPANAMEKGGRVVCQFVIEKDGRISDIQVVRTSGETSLDKEAVRVISSMPKWKPGKQRGKPVRVTYTLPVIFRLQ
jgi:TonB family protein